MIRHAPSSQRWLSALPLNCAAHTHTHAAYLPLNPVPVASTPQPDVYPGLGGRLRVSTAEWNGFSLQIPNDTVLLYIFDTGRADAAAFAGASGLVTPSAIQAALDNTVALTSNGTRQ
jgi:hypothetical protein